MSASPTPEKQASPPPPTATATTDYSLLPTSLAAQFASAHKVDVKTDTSFCLPTSLAFFRDLVWEQTPWIPRFTDEKRINPITATDARNITSRMDLDQEAVQNGFLFGSSADHQLYIIFPHADANPARDERFLTIWHDEIVKPAFDRAWKDSGLALRHGAELESKVRILPPMGVRTLQDAVPAIDIVRRLNLNSAHIVSAPWPSSPAHLEEAWDSVTGMLRAYPGLEAFQDPQLLAIYRAEIHLNATMKAGEIYAEIAKEWDGKVDARFVVKNSFRVVLETTLATRKEKKKEKAREVENKRKKNTAYGLGESESEDKRDKVDEDDEGHRSKRRKK
jgi:hypothetical protein